MEAKTVTEIRPSSALYIKLGHGGEWEKQCIFENQTIRFGYREVSHSKCVENNWAKVEEDLRSMRSDQGAITRDLNQIKQFYTANENVLWITFHQNFLWWCFSRPTFAELEDHTKLRSVVGRWSNRDVEGNELSMDKLRGSFLAKQGFRGTISQVKEEEFEYLVNKINGRTPRRIEDAQKAYESLLRNIERLVRSLHWKDFELLVDLIFRQAGWKRISDLGKTQKSIDLVLLSPIVNEKISASVKSSAGIHEFEEYRKNVENADYAKCFFIVHTPDSSLEDTQSSNELRYLGPREVARLCLDYGLFEWLRTKAE